MKLKPESRKEKLTVLSIVLGVAGGFTTIGGSILLWEDLRPWMSELEEKTLHERACEGQLATIQSDIFKQQANEAETRNSLIIAAERSVKTTLRKIIRASLEAQQVLTERYKTEKRECEEKYSD